MTKDSKLCVGCGKKFRRPNGVSQSDWNQRKYCSQPCYLRSPRSTRKVSYDAKTCEECGRKFERPKNQRGNIWASRTMCSMECVRAKRDRLAWENRPERTCPICLKVFRTRQPIHRKTTCGDPECKARYMREIAVPKRLKSWREAEARGEIQKKGGTSPRELALRPLLGPHGWSWHLRWFEDWGCFEMDFAFMPKLINVELDGEGHRWPGRKKKDQARDAELTRRGWTVLRIPNAEVDASPESVAERILSLAS